MITAILILGGAFLACLALYLTAERKAAQMMQRRRKPVWPQQPGPRATEITANNNNNNDK